MRHTEYVLLTGAGASIPLGLPGMDGLIAPNYFDDLPPELAMVFGIGELGGAGGEKGERWTLNSSTRLWTCYPH